MSQTSQMTQASATPRCRPDMVTGAPAGCSAGFGLDAADYLVPPCAATHRQIRPGPVAARRLSGAGGGRPFDERRLRGAGAAPHRCAVPARTDAVRHRRSAGPRGVPGLLEVAVRAVPPAILRAEPLRRSTLVRVRREPARQPRLAVSRTAVVRPGDRAGRPLHGADRTPPAPGPDGPADGCGHARAVAGDRQIRIDRRIHLRTPPDDRHPADALRPGCTRCSGSSTGRRPRSGVAGGKRRPQRSRC